MNNTKVSINRQVSTWQLLIMELHYKLSLWWNVYFKKELKMSLLFWWNTHYNKIQYSLAIFSLLYEYIIHTVWVYTNNSVLEIKDIKIKDIKVMIIIIHYNMIMMAVHVVWKG